MQSVGPKDRSFFGTPSITTTSCLFLTAIGKNRRKVNAELLEPFPSQKIGAVISIEIPLEFSPTHRGQT
jgi:hypothetical protein